MRRSLVAVPAALILVAACQQPAPAFGPDDTAAIQAMADSVVAEIRAADFEAWASHFTEDGRFHPSNGRALVGRPALLAWARSLPPITQFSFSPMTVVGDGNTAYGWSQIVLQFEGLPVDTSKQLAVYRRNDAGQWQVAAVSVTSDLPLPQPAAPRR